MGRQASAPCSLCPQDFVTMVRSAPMSMRSLRHSLADAIYATQWKTQVLHQADCGVHCLQGLSQTGGCLAFSYQLLCPALRSGLRRQDTNTETRPPSCCINTSMMRVAYDRLWSAGKTSMSTEQSVCSLKCMPEVCLTVCSGQNPSMLHCPDCLLCMRIFPSDIVQHASECSNTEAAHIRPVLRQ